MASLQIKNELHKEIKKIIEQKKIEYPSIQNFVEKAILEKIKSETQ